MELPVLIYGDPLLRKKCQSIADVTEEVRQLVQDLIETMYARKGAGLAASQVGHLVRIFVACKYVEDPEGHVVLTPPKVYINPKLSSYSEEVEEAEEGCLSIPGIRASVVRPHKVTIEALDLDGTPFQEEETGYNARVLMHENDHLNGVLFIDRLDTRTRNKLEPHLRSLKKKQH